MSNSQVSWVSTKLGSVIQLTTGKLDANAASQDGSYPFFTCGRETLRIDKYAFDQEAILLAGNGDFGVKHYVGKFNAYQRTYVIHPLLVDGRFLFSLISFKVPEITKNERGSTIGYIRKGDIEETEVQIPPLPEQRRIVSKIDSLSGKSKRARDHLNHVTRLVEKYKQAVLAMAFGMRWSEFRFEHTLPTKTLGEIADIQTGITLGKKRSPDERLVELPYLRVANVQRGWLNLSEVKSIMVTQHEAARLALLSGDILMNEGGDRDKLGRGWVWSGEIDHCIHQNHVFRVRLKDSRFPPSFISYFANEFGRFHFFAEGKQTTNLASISKTKLSDLIVPVPDPETALGIVRRIETAFAWIDRLASEATSARKLIDHLDQAILSKAFRGELVPQDPNDEPASVLLERIKAERTVAKPAKGRRRSP